MQYDWMSCILSNVLSNLMPNLFIGWSYLFGLVILKFPINLRIISFSEQIRKRVFKSREKICLKNYRGFWKMGLTWNYQQQTKFLILWGCHASAAIVTEQLNQINDQRRTRTKLHKCKYPLNISIYILQYVCYLEILYNTTNLITFLGVVAVVKSNTLEQRISGMQYK